MSNRVLSVRLLSASVAVLAMMFLCPLDSYSQSWVAGSTPPSIVTSPTNTVVGVGTTSPDMTRMLMISNDSSTSPFVMENRNSASSTTATTGLLFRVGTTATTGPGATGEIVSGLDSSDFTKAYLAFRTLSGGVLTEKFRIASNGSFGFGTATPISPFTFSYDATGLSSPFLIENRNSTAIGTGLLFRYKMLTGASAFAAGVTTQFMGTDTTPSADLFFRTLYWNGTNAVLTERMRITSAGYVGIGFTPPINPTYPLSVNGTIYSASGGFRFPDGTTQTTAATTTATINASNVTAGTFGGGTYAFGGNVGIGTTSPQTRAHFVKPYTTDGSGGTTRPDTSWGVYKGDMTLLLDTGGSRTVNRGGGVGFSNSDGFVLGAIKGAATNSTTSEYGGYLAFYTTGPTSGGGPNGYERMRIDQNGNVGIGTTTPTKALDVVGDINVSGNINAKYQDVAEWVPADQPIAAGTVVVLDPEHTNHVLASAKAYDSSVAGVISANPGLVLGEPSKDKVKVATTGRVRVQVDASSNPIHVGDLLVTSDIPGVAMKSVPVDLGGISIHRPGTILGKAIEPLDSGRGEILVLLTLQ